MMPAECSLLMLTKNSLKYLKYTLTWCRLEFDDFVVLDAGSIDGTVDYLKRYNAKIITDTSDTDFAALRNRLAAEAAHDWVFQLDADEVIDWNFLANMKIWLSPQSKSRLPDAVALRFPRYNEEGRAWPDYQTRCYMKSKAEWRRPIHEILWHLETDKPMDAPTTGFDHSIYCQTLMTHPIHHLPHTPQEDAITRTRWLKLEDETGIRPP